MVKMYHSLKLKSTIWHYPILEIIQFQRLDRVRILLCDSGRQMIIKKATPRAAFLNFLSKGYLLSPPFLLRFLT